MKPATDRRLSAFHEHLTLLGRGEKTVNLYCYLVSIHNERSLVSDEESPNYLHTIRAALKAWAEFTSDEKLETHLKRVRLPPALPMQERKSLTKAKWVNLIDEIYDNDYMGEPCQAYLGMLARRGFRSSDVLRLKKKEVKLALKEGTLTYYAKGRRRLNFPVTDNWRDCLETFAGYKDWNQVWDLIAPSGSRNLNKSAADCGRRLLSYAATNVKAGHVNLHLLRKTYATHYYLACQDPVMLKDHMQWANIETAMRYVAVSDRKALEEVASSLFE